MFHPAGCSFPTYRPVRPTTCPEPERRLPVAVDSKAKVTKITIVIWTPNSPVIQDTSALGLTNAVSYRTTYNPPLCRPSSPLSSICRDRSLRNCSTSGLSSIELP